MWERNKTRKNKNVPREGVEMITTSPKKIILRKGGGGKWSTISSHLDECRKASKPFHERIEGKSDRTGSGGLDLPMRLKSCHATLK